VITIGTATLAAFIGAGGLGEFIVTGLALNNTQLILQGAIPAAVLAIIVEFLFELVEKMLIPKHLRT
jgi:osmoprotectant transport system permease protein